MNEWVELNYFGLNEWMNWIKLNGIELFELNEWMNELNWMELNYLNQMNEWIKLFELNEWIELFG